MVLFRFRIFHVISFTRSTIKYLSTLPLTKLTNILTNTNQIQQPLAQNILIGNTWTKTSNLKKVSIMLFINRLCESPDFEMLETVTTEYNWLCTQSKLSSLSTSFAMSGILLGAFTSGIFADWIGRKRTMLFYSVGASISCFILAVVPNSELCYVCMRPITILENWLKAVVSVLIVWITTWIKKKVCSWWIFNKLYLCDGDRRT